MEKNIIVLDHFKNAIGLTYEKRAKQLVKKARAQWLNANTIFIFKGSEKVEEDSKMSELWEITSQSNDIKQEKDINNLQPLYKSVEAESILKYLIKDNSFIIFILSNVIIAIGWFISCLGISNSFYPLYDYAELIYTIGLAMQVFVFAYKLSYYINVKSHKEKKSDINFNQSLTEQSFNNDSKFNDFINEEFSPEQLKKDIIKSMNDKRNLIMHSCAYIIVNLTLFMIAYVFDSEVIGKLFFITLCLWSIGVFMHWVHYLTEVTHAKVAKEIYRIKNQ